MKLGKRRHLPYQGLHVEVEWGSHPWKREALTGTVINVGNRTIWIFSDSTEGKPAQDVFIKHDHIKLIKETSA